MDFTGPGTVWYQTRGLDTFTESIVETMPNTGDDGGGGFNIEF
jgi:uncharacterized protein (AIM24 family)